MQAEEREEHPRLLLPRFLPQNLCKELEFIHKSCCAVGYRPGVLSTTMSHLVATDCAHLVVPFVTVREMLREKVEDRFGCEFELFVEFTGLVSWCKGASIGWHSDDNRPYLKQRDFAAVCYLNSYGEDFRGGIFRFKDGYPTSIAPQVGDVLIYTADCRNIHSVDEVIEGERLTLTLWFTRDKSHDEDAKLISLLSSRVNQIIKPRPTLPFPAPNAMYWFTSAGSGFDIRWARLHVLGWKIHPQSTEDFSEDPLRKLIGPLRLGNGKEVLDVEFSNILHGLQAVQFYCWKSSSMVERGLMTRETSEAHLASLGDLAAAESIFGSGLVVTVDDSCQKDLDVAGQRLAVSAWEDYVRALDEILERSLPAWQTNQLNEFTRLIMVKGYLLLANMSSGSTSPMVIIIDQPRCPLDTREICANCKFCSVF
ncbi:2-oxoglutarate (2OG) and Fe(II)-dependent oxygenase superfamily protein isoform X2 [Wolffia australiana]